jgi:peptide/nickel transport system substrate-binding protein
MNDIYLLVAQHLPVITLFSNPDWYEYNDKDFTGFVSRDDPFVRPVIWSDNAERLIHILNIKPRK